MPLPNFLIIGAGRTGTTSLHHYLRQHPEIFMPDNKEPRFFIYEGVTFENIPGKEEWQRNTITNIDSYKALFADVKSEKAYGEASVEYFRNAAACERIYRLIPHVKLIVGLRHPLESVFSHYRLFIREGLESEQNFLKALLADMRSHQKCYFEGGLYYRHLREYIHKFGKEQIFTYLYDELKNNPMTVLKNIFDFIGVSSDFIPDISRILNATDRPGKAVLKKVQEEATLSYNPLLEGPHRLGLLVNRWIPLTIRKAILDRPLISKRIPNEKFLEDLMRFYQKDTKKLQQLIKKDLSPWMDPNSYYCVYHASRGE